MTARATFRQAELDRIFKAAKRAGLGARLSPDGTVEVLTDSDTQPKAGGKLREKVFGHGAQA